MLWIYYRTLYADYFDQIATSHFHIIILRILFETHLFSNCLSAPEERSAHATISVHFALARLLMTGGHACVLRAVRRGQVGIVAIACGGILFLLLDHISRRILSRLNFLQIERAELQLNLR